MTEYYVSQMSGSTTLFKVAKFSGNDQPENVYFVVMKQEKKSDLPEMHCDCPNRRRGKHINDKHGQMVAKWIIAGKPQGFFDKDGNFHGSRDAADAADADASGGGQEPGAEDEEDDSEDDSV